MRLDTLVIMRRGRSRATAFGLDPVAARNAPRASSQDDGRASQTTSGRRPLGTTSRSPRRGSDHRRRREPAAPHVALAAMRAITHVVGKANRVVAQGSTGRRLLVEGDQWRLRQDADVEQRDCLAVGVGPVVVSRGRIPGWTPRWGKGSLGHTSEAPNHARPRYRIEACCFDSVVGVVRRAAEKVPTGRRAASH